MKAYKLNQLFSFQKVRNTALKTLIQKKHEIRINLDSPHIHRPQNPKAVSQTILQKPISKGDSVGEAYQNNKIRSERSPLRQENGENQLKLTDKNQLYEVIYRQGRRIAINEGREQVPYIRNYNMSRTFRRKRRSNLRDYSTINHDLSSKKQGQQETQKKYNHLAISNLELSGFTNSQILKNTNISSIKPLIQGKYIWKNHRESWLKCRKGQTIQPSPIHSQNKLSFDQISRSSKNESILVRKSYSSNDFCNPQTKNQTNQQVKQASRQQKYIQINKLTIERICGKNKKDNNPFIHQTKPFWIDKKRLSQRRSHSQFVHSRPKVFQKVRMRFAEDSCRPWSVFKNFNQEKIQPPKPLPDDHFQE